MLKYEKDMVTELDRKLELKETKEKAYQEGRAEEKKSIAKSLLAKGMSVKDIIEITGLSEEMFS